MSEGRMIYIPDERKYCECPYCGQAFISTRLRWLHAEVCPKSPRAEHAFSHPSHWMKGAKDSK